jgi:antitoxin component YwqK of YwqJK toxin-antitoxin module
MSDKYQYNANGKKHGYWERYWSNDNLYYIGNFVNGKRSGYWEFYNFSGELMRKSYFL